jgi:serine/threonine protein kinase
MSFTYAFKSQSSYVFKKYIGGGGSADVLLYNKLTPGLPDQDIVLKVLKETDEVTLNELLNDGNCLSILNHPNILASFGFERLQNKKLALLLEYFPGESLEKLLPKIQIAQRSILASHIIRSLLDALIAAHSRGIVHGDISSRNILISETGQIKLADFGLATIKTHKIEQLLKRNQVSHKASIDYLAPERWMGGISTEQADIFAVGLLAFEILVGKKCFENINLKSGKEVLNTFLSLKPWRNANEHWQEFFRCTLSEDPVTRTLAKNLVSLIPPSEEVVDITRKLATYVAQSGVKRSESLLKTIALRTSMISRTCSLKVLKSASVAAVFFICLFSGQLVPCEEGVLKSSGPVLLTLTSRPWGSIFIDKQFKGYTPIVRFKLKPGYHEIVWRSPNGVEIKKTLQAYKTRPLHYKIQLENSKKPLTIEGGALF